MAQGEPNIEGALAILVDLLTANSFTMTRSPYENNMRGLVDALIDLNAGDLFFLSDSTAGAITTTAPSGAGKAVTRVGEASTTTDFAIQIEPPILLR
jgi:hypothetical protein